MIIKCAHQGYQICSNAGCVTGCIRDKRDAPNNPNSGITLLPRGCICPPTSEQTCQSPTCPRKAVRHTGHAMNKELREAVAAAMYEAYRDMYNDDLKPWEEAGPGIKSVYHHKADAAISIIRPAVLEEAAKVAEGLGVYERRSADNPYSMGRLDVAAAIRALAKEGE